MNKFTLIIFCALSCIIILSQSIIAAEKRIGSGEHLKVEFIFPKEGERVHGNIAVEARVNHPEAIEYCEFYIQEPGARDRYGWKDYSPSYFWGGDGQVLDTTMFDDGPASAVAFCFSKDRKPARFENRVHFIIDNGKPQIRILSPKAHDIVNGKALIQIDAEDSKGINSESGIAAVYVYLDGSILRKMMKPPFETFIETCLLSSGLHSIRVIAEDKEGLTAADRTTVYIP